MDAKFEIKGLKELNKELKALPDDFRNKALAGAVGAASRVIRDTAITLVPTDTGNVKGAIRAQKKKSPSIWLSKYQVNVNPKGKVTILRTRRSKKDRKRGVAIKRNNASSSSTYYAKFIEEGTAKMPARPFMRTAFALKKVEAVETFKRILDKKIRFYQRKIARLRS
jgi:HK97 gp10 family phage protein